MRIAGWSRGLDIEFVRPERPMPLWPLAVRRAEFGVNFQMQMQRDA